MKLHHLKPAEGAKKERSRVGRGRAGVRGKTAGRGTKGQGARGGKPKGAYFEGGQLPLVRRLPFKRGFTNIFRIEYQEVKVEQLELLDNGFEVTPEFLAEARWIRDADKPVVILGNGDLTKKLTVKAHRVTRSAQQKIEVADEDKDEAAYAHAGRPLLIGDPDHLPLAGEDEDDYEDVVHPDDDPDLEQDPDDLSEDDLEKLTAPSGDENANSAAVEPAQGVEPADEDQEVK